MKLRINDLTILLFALCFSMACNPREEGCLDPEAVNFNVDAEKACGDCCTYPELFFNVKYSWGDSTFKLNEVFYTGPGDSLIFTRASILLSGIGLVKDNNDTLRVRDHTELDCGQGITVDWVDDAVLVDRSRFDFPIGMIGDSPHIQEVFWYAGLPFAFQCYDPDVLPAGHPLSRTGNYDVDLQKAVAAKLVYSKDSLQTFDTIHLDFEALLFTANPDITLRFAVNDTLPLNLDYDKLFEGVNLEAPDAEVKEQLTENFPEFIEYR